MDYSHWDLVQDFFLQHVVYLWFEGRLDETTAHPALDLTARLIEAIRAGELPCADAVFVEPGSLADLALGDRLDKNAYRYWRLKRDDLRAWCELHGFRPAFLFPEVRQPAPAQSPQPDSGPADTALRAPTPIPTEPARSAIRPRKQQDRARYPGIFYHEVLDAFEEAKSRTPTVPEMWAFAVKMETATVDQDKTTDKKIVLFNNTEIDFFKMQRWYRRIFEETNDT